MAVIKSTKRKLKVECSVINAIEYITDNDKISEVYYYNGTEQTDFWSAVSAAEYMNTIRASCNKNTQILAHHYIQSFAPEDNVTPEQAHEIGKKFMEQFGTGHAVVFATHIDCGHIHNHFIVNSVNCNTRKKWNDNNATLENLREASDNLCREYNLSVIEKSDNQKSKSVDQATSQLTKQGKSWKAELINTLDEAFSVCKTKLDFIDFMNRRGFKVFYRGKNITFKKDGCEQVIRADTLAKQYGEKYSKASLDNAFVFNNSIQTRVIADDWETVTAKPTKFPFKAETQKKGWREFETWFFEELAKTATSAISKNDEEGYANVELQKLLQADGTNFTALVNANELARLANANFFFYAEKQKERDEAIIHLKEYNKSKLEKRLTILEQVADISHQYRLQHPDEFPNEKIKPIEKQILKPTPTSEELQNLKLNKGIKKRAEELGEKPLYKVVTDGQLAKIKKSGGEFAYFRRDDGRYNITFLKSQEQIINKALQTKLSNAH